MPSQCLDLRFDRWADAFARVQQLQFEQLRNTHMVVVDQPTLDPVRPAVDPHLLGQPRGPGSPNQETP